LTHFCHTASGKENPLKPGKKPGLLKKVTNDGCFNLPSVFT
jgi:hypothetical protein